MFRDESEDDTWRRVGRQEQHLAQLASSNCKIEAHVQGNSFARGYRLGERPHKPWEAAGFDELEKASAQEFNRFTA